MKRLLIERVIIYILGFLFCFFTALSQGNKASNVEQDFLNNISTIMNNYNYAKTENITGDLEYIQNDNSIILEYKVYSQKVQTKTIRGEFHLNYANDLNSIYSLLSDLSKENILKYNNEIQKLIKDFNSTGEEQMWQDLNSDRQLTFRIEKTSSVGKDFKLYYSAMIFNN